MNILPKRQEGQGLVEYALVLVLIAVVVIVILQLMGSSVILAYAKVMGGFSGQTISGNGNEGILVSYGLTETSTNTGFCRGTYSNVYIVFTQDGQIVTNQDVNFSIDVGGASYDGSVSVPNSGLAYVEGTSDQLTSTNRCPFKPVVNWVP